MLQNKLDDPQQYQHRSCIVIDGIGTAKEETVEQITQKTKNILTKNPGIPSSEVGKKIEKCHSIGAIKNDKQPTITYFKSHSFRSKVSRKTMECKNKKIRVSLSGTTKRLKNLDFANKLADQVNHIDFTYENGNLKFYFKESLENNKTIYSFKMEDDLQKYLMNCNGIFQY